jgi:hypothetical protein
VLRAAASCSVPISDVARPLPCGRRLINVDADSRILRDRRDHPDFVLLSPIDVTHRPYGGP